MTLKSTYLITYILSFMSLFIFQISGLNILSYYFFIGLFFLLIKPKFTLNTICKLIASKPTKYLFFFIIWLIFGIIISVYTMKFDFRGFLMSFLGGLVLSIILPLLMQIIAIPRICKIKKIIQVTTLIFLSIFTLGIVEFVIYSLDLSPLTYVWKTLLQKRTPYSLGFPRVSSVFGEPSFLGFFIIVTCPIIYYISKSKSILFSNPVTDKLVKRLVFIFMVFNLFLTQSPIYILMGLVLSIFFLRDWIFRFKLKTVFICINIVILLSLTFLPRYLLAINESFDINKTVLKRVKAVVENVSDFRLLVIAEPSLSSRIINCVTNISIFMKNPIIGVGYGNLNPEMLKEFESLSIPLTPELAEKIYSPDAPSGGNGTAIFFRLLAETGIIGTFLFYMFLFSLLRLIQLKIKDFFGIERDFLIGLKYFIILLIINSVYTSHPHWTYLWLLLGIAQAMILTRVNKPLNNNQVES
ncbi:MAG: hypothetical protein ACD_20C00413G0006 [uncultured bacterium]|nr:MAG: hypothetical protein ACD_20C00413G0006 [uncultured bacterium]